MNTKLDPKEIRRARKRQTADARRMISDFRPPEGVVLNFHVAGIGARFTAQILDLVVTGVFALAVLLMLWTAGIGGWSFRVALASLLFFFIRSPYYILAELIWNGQTFGKRLTSLRVISADGRSLRPYAVTVRNLTKEVEVFVPGTMLIVARGLSMITVLVLILWIAILLIVPLVHPRRQRLGDMIAGTYVVFQPKVVLLPDLSARIDQQADDRFTFLPHQLDHYGKYELQTLEKILHVDTTKQSWTVRNKHRQNLGEIVARIARKIEYTDPVLPRDNEAFLEAFYRAQRQYLESRRLFGDERPDKFHQMDEKKKAP